MSTEFDSEQLEKAVWTEVAVTEPPAYIRIKNKIVDISRPWLSRRDSGSRKQLGRTAYLDGLRGFAALLVYFQHHQTWSHGGGIIFENGFGWDGHYKFACLPGIRLFFTGGHLAVTVFFVISGYVLSAKPLSLIQSGESAKLVDNVGSALFRRWIRLYIPVIVTTFLYMTSWHAFGIWTESEEHEANFRTELWKYYCELKNFSYVFTTGGPPWFTYNRHVWSIPVEFKGSILIYTSLMAFSRCTRNARLWCEVALMFYFIYIVDGAYNAMFMAGMFLSDLDMLAQNDNLPRWLKKLEPYKEIFYYHFFFIAIYLGGVPAYDNNDSTVLGRSYGWHYLSYLKPQAVFDHKWFYLFWGSIMMVSAVPRIPWLKRFFESRFNQYLGRISYALYLVHGPVLRILGDRMYVAVGYAKPAHTQGLPGYIGLFPLPKAGPYGLEFSFILVNCVTLPVTLWVADFVTRTVDTPSVKFARWLHQQMLGPAPTLKS